MDGERRKEIEDAKAEQFYNKYPCSLCLRVYFYFLQCAVNGIIKRGSYDQQKSPLMAV